MKHSLVKLPAAGLLLALAVARPALAQNSAVSNAQLSLQANQVDKAITSINQAIENEKTKDKAKTWFVRGDVYARLVDPSYKALLAKMPSTVPPAEAIQKATESYKKALALDGPTGEFGKQVPAKLTFLYQVAFNDAVNAYNAKDFDKAIASYRLASTVQPKDTAVLFMAYAQSAKQDYAGARESYNQLLGMGYKNEAVYNQLLLIAQDQKDQAEMRRVLDQALVAYPNNKTFLLQDLNLSMGNPSGGAGVLEKINKAIQIDPGNSSLYAVRGSIYDQLNKSETNAAKKQENGARAVADYKKALELDPNNFDAQYNLGIYNYNQAASLYSKANAIKDVKQYQLKEAEAKKYDEASLPYFEKALALKPEDEGTLFALRKVYGRLNRAADAKMMDDRMQALKK